MGRYSGGLVNECLENLNNDAETLKYNVWKALFTFSQCEDDEGDYYEGHKEKLEEMNREYERIQNDEDEVNLVILKHQIEAFCVELKSFDEADDMMEDWEYENNRS